MKYSTGSVVICLGILGLVVPVLPGIILIGFGIRLLYSDYADEDEE